MEPEVHASPPPLRLFVALWPDPATREAVAQWQNAWKWPDRAAPEKPERLHLTLHFLGNVPAQRVAALVGGLRVPCEPFSLELGRGEVWPNGVAVLRPESVPPPLLALHAALSQRVTDFGLPVDSRPFRPHITLARRATGARAPPRGPRLRWQADHGYVLVSSLPGGAGYKVLARFD
ncbi:MAG TPA: RNA 2',3'-cyclic phosphodiesterase [Ramlibacter sp.]|nr:RNA 2',3'-cyclic phosphodiesterase [Ramlibacter sp.]